MNKINKISSFYSNKMKNLHTGFTVLELTIVFTIIAFIVGIIISSNALITNSQIRSVIIDVNSYKNTVKLFEERYGGLPGDIAASNFWSGANNGNEDGRIGWGVNTAADFATEPTYAWQHLSLAKLVQFKQMGSLAYPLSKIDGAYYTLYDQPKSYPMYNRIGTYLVLSGTTSTAPFIAGLTRPLASAIDLKMDDGVPSSGMAYSFRGTDMNSSCSGSSCVCVTANWNNATWSSFTSASYVYGDSSKSCVMLFWLKELN